MISSSPHGFLWLGFRGYETRSFNCDLYNKPDQERYYCSKNLSKDTFEAKAVAMTKCKKS